MAQRATKRSCCGRRQGMLRQPDSRYEAGRSSTLLKCKRFLDADARVVGHEPGKGRHKGRLGALVVELPNGKQFCVGSGLTDADREKPPAIGSIITFRYQELSDGGIPRFPSFVRARGRLGTDGQPQTKKFADTAAATKHAEKLIDQKLAKGYSETAVA
jgi:hypothetical protein